LKGEEVKKRRRRGIEEGRWKTEKKGWKKNQERFSQYLSRQEIGQYWQMFIYKSFHPIMNEKRRKGAKTTINFEN